MEPSQLGGHVLINEVADLDFRVIWNQPFDDSKLGGRTVARRSDDQVRFAATRGFD